VLIGTQEGRPRTDFTGRLFVRLAGGGACCAALGTDSDRRPALFGRGYGLDYTRASSFQALPEALTTRP